MSAVVIVQPSGPLRTNVVLVGDPERREAIAIDPAIPSLSTIVGAAAEQGWRIVLAVVTHGHWDHMGELAALSEHVRRHEQRELPIGVHPLDQDRLLHPRPIAAPFPIPEVVPSRELRDGETIHAGRVALRVLHTPGHTEGSVSLHDQSAGVLFSGDTLFRGAWGRTDLPGGDERALLESLQRLATLDPATRVIPGHGAETTIAAESVWIQRAARRGSLA
jgi:hydroxyacylglutathione hydrolase